MNHTTSVVPPSLRCLALAAACIGALTGCGQSPYRSQPAPVSTPEPVVSVPSTPVTPASPTVTAAPVPPPLPAAAAALVAAADQQRRAGDYARAAASLERALGISPQSAELWHQLAAVRLAAGELGQAAQLAARSNALAGDDPDLKARNRTILEAAGGP